MDVIQRYKKALEEKVVENLVDDAVKNVEYAFKGLEINRTSQEILLRYVNRRDGTEKIIVKKASDVQNVVPAINCLFKRDMQAGTENIKYELPKLADIC